MLLPFVFALAEFFINLEPGFLGGGDGNPAGRIEQGEHFADGFFAGGAMGQLAGAQGAAQGELAAAHLAITGAQFVFVEWHYFVLLNTETTVWFQASLLSEASGSCRATTTPLASERAERLTGG